MWQETDSIAGNPAPGIDVSAAAIIEEGRLLIVSKKAAPEVFYLPGGKPEPGESAEEALIRELDEEIGVTPTEVAPLARVRDVAALEGVPMRLTVFTAAIDRAPRIAAELAALGWTSGSDRYAPLLAPAIRNQVVPLLVRSGLLPG
ncbi:NUDIX hydrolase [Microtetraspora malaysiensis]|uniref:NUDIX hydrolase n=1 Tax=Microtetraspora malaysiensis TaxID=161358 RepID=UPI000AAECB4D|nr:NUDIX domain-containing protein [Microtetraspora malaysiensis]